MGEQGNLGLFWLVQLRKEGDGCLTKYEWKFSIKSKGVVKEEASAADLGF
jgi:hypothetical protein